MKTVPQRSREWVAKASPKAVSQAHLAGELNEVLGGDAPPDVSAAIADGEQLTRESLKTMTPAQIVEAQSKGLLNDVLGTRH